MVQCMLVVASGLIYWGYMMNQKVTYRLLVREEYNGHVTNEQ